ncbi:MAG: hypothetical protein JKY61_00270 [Planctomycetes bacterium]|nr:hypothetical protein [Planctomycetota bacterium]
MKRNPKRLKRILKVRQLQEEAARAAWIQAQVVAREADALVEKGHHNIVLGQDFIRGQQASGSISGVLNSDAAMKHLHTALAHNDFHAAARHRDVDAAKAPWLETRKAACGMEKLVERAQEEHRIELRLKEDQALESSLEALLTRQTTNNQTSQSA